MPSLFYHFLCLQHMTAHKRELFWLMSTICAGTTYVYKELTVLLPSQEPAPEDPESVTSTPSVSPTHVPSTSTWTTVCIKKQACSLHSHNAILDWEFPKTLSQNCIYVFMLLLTRNTKTMHCGILSSIPYKVWFYLPCSCI